MLSYEGEEHPVPTKYHEIPYSFVIDFSSTKL